MKTQYGPQAPGGCPVSPCDAAFGDAVVVQRRMREHRRAGDLAHRPDAWRARPQGLVDEDEALGIKRHAGDAKADAFRHWPPPHRHQKMRAAEVSTVAQLDRNMIAGAARHDGIAGVKRQFDTGFLEQGLDGGRHIGVLPRRQLRPRLEDHDFAAEPAEGLRHLHADISAAQYQQPGGPGFELERLDVGHRRCLGQSGDWRDRGNGAEVQIDPLGGDPPDTPVGLDLDHTGLDETTQPRISSRPLAWNARKWKSTISATTDAVRAATLTMSVVSTGDVGAERLAVPDGVGDLRAAHQCLGGDAGDVDAGAADHADLDQSYLLAGLRLIHGKRLAGFAAAEDNDVIAFRFGHVHLPKDLVTCAGRSIAEPCAVLTPGFRSYSRHAR